MSHVNISHDLFVRLIEALEDAGETNLTDELKSLEKNAETKEGKTLDVPMVADSIDDQIDNPDDIIGGRPDDRHP